MNREEQTVFVTDLVASVQAKLLADIEAGKVPADWDGHELRHLLARIFARQTTTLAPARKRAFEQVIVVNDLD